MKKLYDKLIANGEYTGSFETFKEQYGDAEKSKKLFDGMSDAGDYTKTFEEFNTQFEFEAKTEAVAEETADVTAVEEAVDTDLESETISLEQFEAMEPAEKKNLKYSDAQRLIKERDAAITLSKQPWGEQFAVDVSSPKFEDLSDSQLLKIKEKASKDLLSQKGDKDTFKITDEQIVIKAKDIFENKVLPNAYTDKKTIIEETFGTNVVTDFLGDLIRAGEQGVSTSELVDPAFDLLKNGSDTSDEDILNFIEKNKSVSEKNVESDEMRNFNKIYKENGEGVLGFIAGAVRNPSILPSLLVSSIATQTSSLRSEEVALAAGVGAAAGSVVPILGTIGGAIGGGAMAMESALTFGELLQETVGNDLSVDKIRAVLEDPEKLSDLRKKSIGRGIAIGAFEGLTGGIAKGIGSKLASKGFSTTTRGVTAGVVESVGGGGGEVAGRIAAGQEMDVREIGFEAITGTATAPISVGRQMLDLDNRINDFKIDKELKNTKFNNLEQAFAPEEKTSEAQMSLVKMKNGSKILRDRVQTSIEAGSITEKQGEDIEINFRNTQSAVNTVEKTNIVSSDKAKAVDLLIERKKRTDNIKTIDDSALTRTESDRVEVINKELEVLVKTGETVVNKDLLETNIKVAEDLSSELGFKEKPQLFETTVDYLAAIKESGFDDSQASGSEGVFVGKGKIFIDKQRAVEVGAVSVATHEILHPVLNALVGDAKAQGSLILDFKKSMSDSQLKYVQEQLDLNVDEVNHDTEFLNYFSDGIVRGNIKYDESTFQKIKNVLKKIFKVQGFKNIDFKKGEDVYDFLKAYNKGTLKGKIDKDVVGAIKKGEKVSGVKVSEADLISDAQQSRSVTDLKQDLESLNDRESEFSEPAEFDSQVSNLNFKIKQAEKIEAKGESTSVKKTVTAKQTASSEKVQKLYEDKNEGYEAEIIKEFEPIISNIAGNPKLQKVPGYDKNALMDALTMDPQGLIDMIGKYETDVNAEKRAGEGKKVPLAGFVNKYLRTRSIAIFDKTLNKTFTEGLDKAANVAAEDISSAPVKEGKLIKATKILNTEQLDRAKKIVSDSPIDSKKLSYKKLKGVTSEITSEITGIPANKINNPAKNLSQGETTTAAMFISKNIDYIRNTLPEGAVSKGASEKLIGTSTGVPKKLLDAFYVKSKRGDNLSPFILRKGLTNNEILEVIGRPKDGKPRPIDPRSPNGSVIKGLIDIVDRNITNELVRTEKGLTPQQQVDAGAGRGDMVFSRNLNNVNILLTNQDFLATDDDFSLNAKNWKKIVKAAGGIPISMNTPEGRELFLNTAISSGLVSKTPESLWRNLQGTTKSIKNEAKETIGRDYASSLPFLNVTEASAWIAKVKESGVKFAPETEVFKDMFNKVNPKAKKKPLEVLLKDPKFIKSQENSLQGLKDIFLALEDVMKDKKNIPMVVALLASTSGYQGAFIRRAAPWKAYQKGYKTNLITQEHTLPASLIAKYLFGEALNGRVKESFKNVEKNYFQVALLEVDDKKLKGTTKAGVKFNYTEKTPEGWTMDDSIWARYFNINVGNNNGGIGPDTMILANGNSVQQEFGVNEMGFKVSKEYINNKIKASESNNDQAPKIIQYSKNVSVQQSIDMLAKTDKALDNARKIDAPVKKIRVFDFDDTLARTKSKVGYTMPDGTTGKIDAETFAKDAGTMEAEGVTWDFSEFSKVMEGKKGPLFEVAKKIQEVRGSEDIFVLTARPADAAGPIKEFLGSLGLDIPLNNITGLGDGSPQAKAGWIVGKAADGYNDFYFTDDAIGNVKAVKEALSVLDVKSKVQQAKIQFSKNLDRDFNEIIENKTGIAAQKNYAKVKAALVGKSKGRLNFFIPPSAEDFVGLLYSTLGKGKIGDTQMKWYKDNLLSPYARAMENITRDRNTLGSNFKALKKELKVVPRDLKKKIKGEVFTKEQAVRVYIWGQTGQDIPGLSKSDLKELTEMVKNDPKLELFAQEIMKLGKGREYIKPSETWTTGTITTDLIESLNTTGRKQYLEQWQQNTDIIFSEKNLNKLEAAYGTPYRKAMENILQRMKSGRNRTFGGDTLTGRFTDWLNGSTAAIMFFNTRSAALQTLSAVNFINFGDNNVLAAGKAFANQPQYWSDFKKLFNSDFLVERRDGLKININEADIADVAKESGVRGVVNKLLKLGFTPTQLADSFAIASGGSTFYRNRLKSLVKDGMDPVAAEKQAMRDFRETAEESQQSSRPDRISSQQAGPLGRIVLAFANTPAQYARLMKKAASDLKNGRGDAKSNISKILYYGVAQNLLFNALQQALFAISFGDEEEDKEKLDDKQFRIINGMVDSVARGTGLGGAVFTVIKNAGIKIYDQTQKNNPKYEDAALELLKISPPISSKVQKIRSAGRTASWNMDDIKEKGFGLDNPAYLATGNVVSAATNVPLDRLVKKVNNLVAASDSEIETYKRFALIAGWSEWELGINKKETKKKNKTGSSTTRRSTTRRRSNTRRK